PCGSVKHFGDDLVGVSGERIDVNLAKTPTDVQKIVFAVAIYEAEKRRQNFGMVRDASISLVDQRSGAEIARFDLSEDAGVESVLIFGELYRYQGDWKFRALGESFAGGLEALVRHYGLEIA
ncbi:MAG: TerD family protein, partial [Thermoguttaceae bacterium]|nr:TerD family protein [Thermoguttaceae bacterium]